MLLHTVLTDGTSFWNETKTVQLDDDGCSYTARDGKSYTVYSEYGKPRNKAHLAFAFIHDERSLSVLEAREWSNRVDRDEETR